MVQPDLIWFCCVWQYNDNTGNPYSDVFWLAALVQSVGELEFGQQVFEHHFLTCYNLLTLDNT